MRLSSGDTKFDTGDTSTKEDIIDETDIFDTFRRTKGNIATINQISAKPGILYDVTKKNEEEPENLGKSEGYFRLPVNGDGYNYWTDGSGILYCTTPSEGLS